VRASSNRAFGNQSDLFIPNMSGDVTSCPDRAVKLCQRLIVAENLLDSRIDPRDEINTSENGSWYEKTTY
jgi:hypothetical protein